MVRYENHEFMKLAMKVNERIENLGETEREL